MTVNWWNFIENLKYMGEGMLGIVVVMGIIIIVTTIIAKVTAEKNNQ